MRLDEATLNLISSAWSSTWRSTNLSTSRSMVFSVAKAKNLEKLWLTRCELITDLGIGCIAVGCRKLKLVCLKWCLRVTDLGARWLAMKCEQIRTLDLSYLPVTVFKCGGYVLGTALHHSMCDGLGATVFFSAIAELARGAERVSVEPVWNRAGLLGPRDPPRVEAARIGEVLRVEKGWRPYQEEVGRVVKEWFQVKEEWLDRLKKLMLEESGVNFTTFEALGAFIWRAKVRASEIAGDQNVKFAYAMNVRRIVKPPIPFGYWGNGCVPMYAQTSAKELVEKPISETAELIKKSKINANNEYVRSFIDFQELHYANGITAGTCVSGFTDWRYLGHSTVDFGWGSPVTVLPVSTNLLGSMEPCFFLPYSSANVDKKDGFKLLVNLRECAVLGFRKEMERFSSQEFDLS